MGNFAENLNLGNRFRPPLAWSVCDISVLLHRINAAVNGQLELTLLKGRQRFDAVSTSNLEVYKFREW